MPMNLVSTVTVSSSGGATSIEFTGIPQTGKDLLILFQHRGTASGSYWATLETNGVGAMQYRNLNGSGSTAASQSSNNHGVTWMESEYPLANTWHSTSILIPNYGLATANKTFTNETTVATNDSRQFGTFTAIITGRTNHSDAITSLRLFATWNAFAQNSLASLYIIS